MDFLWHSVNEEEKENIKREAKKIMDSSKICPKKMPLLAVFLCNFFLFISDIFAADKILVIQGNERVDESVVRTEQVRKEGKEQECDESFRKMFMSNAPEKDNDFIIAEKGKWKA